MTLPIHPSDKGVYKAKANDCLLGIFAFGGRHVERKTMAREVNATQPYTDKLVKLIPTEIVGAYMVLASILGYGPAAGGPTAAPAGAQAMIPDSELKPILIKIVFAILLVLTPIYLRFISKVTNRTQLLVTTLSYVVWVYTLGGPFVAWKIYHALIASVVLVLWS